mmetsp:Transcript_85593/g.220355  ORF Transcript_85593/g.220355 Transcript_85593/m.220355 type:complete len:442 (-) Transcript_85593:448-1773(-)
MVSDALGMVSDAGLIGGRRRRTSRVTLERSIVGRESVVRGSVVDRVHQRPGLELVHVCVRRATVSQSHEALHLVLLRLPRVARLPQPGGRLQQRYEQLLVYVVVLGQDAHSALLIHSIIHIRRIHVHMLLHDHFGAFTLLARACRLTGGNEEVRADRVQEDHSDDGGADDVQPRRGEDELLCLMLGVQVLEEVLRHGHSSKRALDGGPGYCRQEAEQDVVPRRVPPRLYTPRAVASPLLHRCQDGDADANEARAVAACHNRKNLANPREDRRVRLAAEHAKQDQLAKNPDPAQDALNLVLYVAARGSREERACEDHEELWLEEGTTTHGHGDSGTPFLLGPKAEGDQGNGQDHQEGLHRAAGENLMPPESQLLPLGDDVAAGVANKRPSAERGDDAQKVGTHNHRHADFRRVCRRRGASKDSKECEAEGSLQRRPAEDQAR